RKAPTDDAGESSPSDILPLITAYLHSILSSTDIAHAHYYASQALQYTDEGVKTKRKKDVGEKRLRRERKFASADVRVRIERALTQRMFLIDRKVVSGLQQEFRVLGSTGNVYTVTISHLLSCDCPDSQKGNLCKHILFIFLKVLRCPPDDHRVYQTALLTTELTDLFQTAPQIDTPDVLANAAVRRAASGASEVDFEPGGPTRRSIEEDDTCPVCYDTMTEAEERGGKLVWCRAQCGKNFHKECLKMWKKQCQKDHKPITCVQCRATWVDEGGHAGPAAGGGVTEEEGYVNLGRLQGLPEERDESMYSDWRYRRGRRGRYTYDDEYEDAYGYY
ncbi:hypothetical protein HDV00_005708, partial [Rhizophlyctis rosea]